MIVNFCSLPFLDYGYSNVIDFEDLNSQIKYFASKVKFSVEVNTKSDSVRDKITVNRPLGDFNAVDYLYIDSSSENSRINYYFITGKEYETPNTTTLYLKLDVWTSYLFNYQIMDSFIERCHVPRWSFTSTNIPFPTVNTIDEGLDMGEIQQVGEPHKIADFNDSIVVTTTVPIGKLPNVSAGGSANCWEEGQLSPKAFRFLKGFEGFGPRLHDDGYGTLTIGYGVTASEPGIYNQLISEQPITEERAAKVAYDLLQKNYGLRILDAVKALGCNNQNQFDALLSLAYNSGNGSVTGTNSLTQAISLNPNDEATIRPIWESFKVTSGGVHSPGLVARRKQECNMYFGKEFEVRPIDIIGGGTVTENNGDGWLPNG